MERIDELNEQINTLDKSSSKALMVYIISAFLAILTPFTLKEHSSNDLNSSRVSKKVNKTDNSVLTDSLTSVDNSTSKIYKYE